MYSKPQPLRGYLYIGAATFLWGVAATIGRAAFTGRLLPSGEAIAAVGPLILSQTRNSFTFLALLLILGMRRGWPALSVPCAVSSMFLEAIAEPVSRCCKGMASAMP